MSSFRAKESVCPLTFAMTTSSWISGDSLGTVYQALPQEGGKMKELAVLEESAIVALAVSGARCAIGRENEVDLCSLPGMEVSHSMIVRKDQPITHLEFDNSGGHV